MNPPESADLYWTGGPFCVKLGCPNTMQEDLPNKGVEVLEEFRSDCQRQYFAFSGALNGRLLAHEKFKSLLKHPNNTFFVGRGPPDSGQQPGRSTIAQMRQGDFLECLKPGGVFEDQNAKAFLVTIFHRWDEHFRPSIARLLSVPPNAVQCDLMGDLRIVRNAIVHASSDISSPDIARLRILSQIWQVEPGKLTVNDEMIDSLMEQINAIRVRVEAKP